MLVQPLVPNHRVFLDVLYDFKMFSEGLLGATSKGLWPLFPSSFPSVREGVDAFRWGVKSFVSVSKLIQKEELPEDLGSTPESQSAVTTGKRTAL